ncbi:hypothetical protein ACIOD0_09375 [Kitasatospora albolonga]
MAATVVVLLVPFGSGDGTPTGPEDRAGKGQTLPEWISCATTIAVGDVTAVREDEPGPGRIIVELHVTDQIKPPEGGRKIFLRGNDPARVDDRQRIEPGRRVLVVVPRRYDEELEFFQGAELSKYRALIESHSDRAADTPCPPFWSRTAP